MGRGREREGLGDRSGEQTRLSGVERECVQDREIEVREKQLEVIVLDSSKGG